MSKILDSLSTIKDILELPAVKSLSIASVIISVFFVGRCGGIKDIERITIDFAEYKKQAEQTTLIADSLKAEVDGLLLAVNDNENTISVLRNTVEIRTAQKKKLETSIQQLATRVDAAIVAADTTELVTAQSTLIDTLNKKITVLEEITTVQNQQLQEKDTQVLALQKASALSIERGDRLQETLDNLNSVKVENDRWFFGKLKKPSRVQSAVIGAAAVATAVVLVR